MRKFFCYLRKGYLALLGEAYFANKRVATGSLMKGTKELIKGLRTGASTIVKEGGEYVIRKAVVSNLDEIRNIAKIMDDFPNLRALGDNAESLAEKLLKAGDGDTQILSRLNSLPDKAIETFAKDFSQADDILAKFAKDPDLIKAWGKAISSGDDDLVKAINSLKGDADELANVLKHVDDIDAAGGYKVWKGSSLKPTIFNSVDDFADTFDPARKLSSTVRGEAYNYFKQGQWKKLEELFNTHKINGGWPPNDGFINFRVLTLKAGTEIDRYGGRLVGGKFVDNGNFVSPLGSSFESRALPAEYLTTKPYQKYRVIKDIPNVKEGQAIPWFKQEGMGLQYLFDIDEKVTIDWLLRNGFIEIVP